jgi:hypothetical protein
MYIEKKKKRDEREKSTCSIRPTHCAPRKVEIAQIYHALKNPSTSKKGPTVRKGRKFEKW